MAMDPTVQVQLLSGEVQDITEIPEMFNRGYHVDAVLTSACVFYRTCRTSSCLLLPVWQIFSNAWVSKRTKSLKPMACG